MCVNGSDILIMFVTTLIISFLQVCCDHCYLPLNEYIFACANRVCITFNLDITSAIVFNQLIFIFHFSNICMYAELRSKVLLCTDEKLCACRLCRFCKQRRLDCFERKRWMRCLITLGGGDANQQELTLYFSVRALFEGVNQDWSEKKVSNIITSLALCDVGTSNSSWKLKPYYFVCFVFQEPHVLHGADEFFW